MSTHEEFILEYGEKLAEDIFYKFYGDISVDYIRIHDTHKLDIINSNFMATIYDQITGQEICQVQCRDGDLDGSVIEDYGDISPPKKYASVQRLAIDISKIKDEDHLKKATLIFNAWKNYDWFKELERNATYDFHFDPSSKVKEYWRSKAGKRGLIFQSEQFEID